MESISLSYSCPSSLFPLQLWCQPWPMHKHPLLHLCLPHPLNSFFSAGSQKEGLERAWGSWAVVFIPRRLTSFLKVLEVLSKKKWLWLPFSWPPSSVISTSVLVTWISEFLFSTHYTSTTYLLASLYPRPWNFSTDIWKPIFCMVNLHPTNCAFVMFLPSISLVFIPAIVTPKGHSVAPGICLYYYPSWSSLVWGFSAAFTS